MVGTAGEAAGLAALGQLDAVSGSLGWSLNARRLRLSGRKLRNSPSRQPKDRHGGCSMPRKKVGGVKKKGKKKTFACAKIESP